MKFSNIQYVTLDMNTERIIPIKLKQYNKDSQNLIVTLTEKGKKKYLNKDFEKCIFKMFTPDKRPIYNTATINEDGTVSVDITENCCTIAGTCAAELDIVDIVDETLICSMNMSVVISRSACDDKHIIASPEFSALTKLVTENANINDSLNEMQNDLNDAEEIRKANENVRISNENIRVLSETNRVSAESDRESDTATAITNANKAATIAGDNAKDAENAAGAATTATANANKAIQEANTVVESMKSLIANDNIIHADDLGVPGGVATLDEAGYLCMSQIPDRTIEIIYGTLQDDGTFLDTEGNLIEGGINKQYIDTAVGIPYIWSGVEYVATGSKLGLGLTSSAAFPGDRGALLENKVASIEQYHNNIPSSDIKFSNINTPLLGANVQTALEDLTKTATQSRDGLLSSTDKKLLDNYNGIQTMQITLSSSRWTGSSAPYRQIVHISDLISYNSCSIELDPNATVLQETSIVNANITDISYDENTGLTFTASEVVPTIDIPITLSVGASMNVVSAPLYLGNINNASSISYTNSKSGLVSQDVQSGLDELANSISEKESSIQKINTDISSLNTEITISNIKTTAPGTYCYMSNGIVHFVANSQNAYNLSVGWNIVGNIPAEFAPQGEQRRPCLVTREGVVGDLAISNTGVIRIYSSIQTAEQALFGEVNYKI